MALFVTNTLGNICTEALALLNVVGDEESVPARDMGRASKQLQLMLKSWAAQDVQIWMRRRDDISTVDGTAGYDLSTSSISTPEIVSVSIVESGDVNELPLRAINREQYLQIVDKTIEGRPVHYYPQFTENDEDINLWPVPDTVYTLKVDYRLAFTNQDERTDTVEIPDYWLEAASWCLAERLIVPYGKSGQPMADEIHSRAADLYATAAVRDITQDGGGEVQFVAGHP